MEEGAQEYLFVLTYVRVCVCGYVVTVSFLSAYLYVHAFVMMLLPDQQIIGIRSLKSAPPLAEAGDENSFLASYHSPAELPHSLLSTGWILCAAAGVLHLHTTCHHDGFLVVCDCLCCCLCCIHLSPSLASNSSNRSNRHTHTPHTNPFLMSRRPASLTLSSTTYISIPPHTSALIITTTGLIFYEDCVCPLPPCGVALFCFR